MTLQATPTPQSLLRARSGHRPVFRALVCFVLLGGLAGAVMAQREASSYVQTNQAGVNARIEVLGAAWRGPLALGAEQSRILVYRNLGDALSGATSVFVNGEYHTSLVPGAYSELCLAPGGVEVGARQMKAGSRPKDLMDSISALSLQPAQTHYLKVLAQGVRPVLQPVAEGVARQELAGLRLQLHTISRVDRAQECREVAQAAAPAPAAPRQMVLAADALFAFGQGDAAGMSAAGRQSLDRLVDTLRREYVSLQRVHITGHADPLGNAQSNEQLSRQRALTVREYLQGQGLQSASISSEGKGAREPVVSHCGSRATAAAIACNQPNRRVVVEITGAPR